MLLLTKIGIKLVYLSLVQHMLHQRKVKQNYTDLLAFSLTHLWCIVSVNQYFIYLFLKRRRVP